MMVESSQSCAFVHVCSITCRHPVGPICRTSVTGTLLPDAVVAPLSSPVVVALRYPLQ